MRSRTHVTSYRPGAFGHLAHDGKVDTHWVIDPEQYGTLRISWGLAVPVNRVEVIEKNSGHISSLELEIFTGEEWKTIEPVDASERGQFDFESISASGLRISIQTGEEAAGISEVFVHDTKHGRPLLRYGSVGLVEAMRGSEAVILFDGSPYAYSRSGRNLISPRAAEACLADSWTQEVLEFISKELGGSAKADERNKLNVRLKGKRFTLEVGPEAEVGEQIQRLADQAGLEFLREGPLVMVGSGLEALRGDAVVSDLKVLLGRNPYLVSETSNAAADAIVTPTLQPIGLTYQWAGFRSTANPETNADAWLHYAETKAIRSWFNASRSLSRYIKPPEQVTTVEQFEAYKRQIRDNPEDNNVIDTKAFMQRYHEELSAEFGIYNRLGIEVINQTGPTAWPDTLQDDLIQWGATYAATYYLAKHFGVGAHQYGNEPDAHFNKATEEQIARRLTLAADAVHAAIEDVNRYENRNVKAIFSAPVLASDFTGRTARTMMRNLYTRYDGSKSPTPLFQLFNRHRYGNRPHQNALEVKQAKQMMQEEAGKVLPQVFTELNYSTGGNWARPKTTFSNDTPEVFSSIASIWGWMMQAQGVFGIFVFKLNDEGAYSRPGIGPFNNTVTYSMFPEQDPGAVLKRPQQISYGTKNFEVSRLFARGFRGTRPLLKTDIQCSDPEYRAWTTVDEGAERFYLWSVQANEFKGYELEFDLSKLGLPPGALITAETVSGVRHGEVTKVMTLPEDGKIRLHTAPQSALLLTAHKLPLTPVTLYPKADAMVVQGQSAEQNFGGETRLEVGRHSNADQNKISFLTFDLPQEQPPVQRAVLELHGQSVNTHAYDGGFLFRVYALTGGAWSEQAITAKNAPNVYRTVSALQKIDLENYPVGHVTATRDPSTLRVDVTRAIVQGRQENRGSLTFVLIREIYWPGEQTDRSSALLASREAGPENSPKLQLWY